MEVRHRFVLGFAVTPEDIEAALKDKNLNRLKKRKVCRKFLLTISFVNLCNDLAFLMVDVEFDLVSVM